MLSLYVRATDAIRHFSARKAAADLALESGQDAFEYLLVIGGISALIVFAMITPIGTNLVNSVIKGACGAIDNVMSVSCA